MLLFTSKSHFTRGNIKALKCENERWHYAYCETIVPTNVVSLWLQFELYIRAVMYSIHTDLTALFVICSWKSDILKTLWMARAAIMCRITSRSSNSPTCTHHRHHQWLITVSWLWLDGEGNKETRYSLWLLGQLQPSSPALHCNVSLGSSPFSGCWALDRRVCRSRCQGQGRLRHLRQQSVVCLWSPSSRPWVIGLPCGGCRHVSGPCSQGYTPLFQHQNPRRLPVLNHNTFQRSGPSTWFSLHLNLVSSLLHQ